ncbi:MAG: hypothetical protein IJL06_10985, partial [Kiritimatiellae bacterium]|nr:hypothetical protein [Kiritimatiellia bacterium]
MKRPAVFAAALFLALSAAAQETAAPPKADADALADALADLVLDRSAPARWIVAEPGALAEALD